MHIQLFCLAPIIKHGYRTVVELGTSQTTRCKISHIMEDRYTSPSQAHIFIGDNFMW